MNSPQQLINVATVVALAALVALPRATATPFAYNPYMAKSSHQSKNECDRGMFTRKPSHGIQKFATIATQTVRTSALPLCCRTKSPAFGAIAPDIDDAYSFYVEFAYPVITDNSSTKQTDQTPEQRVYSPEQGVVQRRRLEASSKDLQKLETFFETSLEMSVKNLSPSAAYYVMPWPSSYWAIYQDGINYRWDSENPSASEKYATTFGLDAVDFVDKVSSFTGALSMKSRQQYTSSSDCAGLNDGSACAIRDGEQEGRCIPTWFGLCHAWAPASLLEPEPRCAVEKNGVTFQPMDIKALLTQVYDDGNIGTVFTGARYYGWNTGIPKDQYGRYTDGSRRDLGPGVSSQREHIPN